MSRPLFTVVIPTIGRPSLRATLLSIRGQASAAVAEIIVVMDTHGGLPEGAAESVSLACQEFGFWPLSFDAGSHDTGSPQLHMGFMRAQGYYILNCGDDDVYEPGAFEAIRAAETGIPMMFRVELLPNAQRGNREPVVLWQERRIERFNVTGQSFVCPNDPRRMGRWVDDVTFIRETVALHGGRVEWREELIARCY